MRARALLLVVPLIIGCGSSVPPSPVPTILPSPSPAATTVAPSPTPQTTPSAAALLDFPPDSAVALEPGRYSSQPPFDIPFSFAIPVDGWGTAHHHGEFFDVIQPVAMGVSPTRWVAFARPHVLHSTAEIDAAGLNPADVVAAFQSRDDIYMSEPVSYEIDGLAGLMVDMSTDQPNVEPFGGPAGDFQLDPAFEGRTIIVTVLDAPLLVMIFAPRGQLEEAWADSQPIVDSISW